MRVIIPKEIEKVEIADNYEFIKIYFKNGEFDKYVARIQSSIDGIMPVLEISESRQVVKS